MSAPETAKKEWYCFVCGCVVCEIERCVATTGEKLCSKCFYGDPGWSEPKAAPPEPATCDNCGVPESKYTVMTRHEGVKSCLDCSCLGLRQHKRQRHEPAPDKPQVWAVSDSPDPTIGD